MSEEVDSKTIGCFREANLPLLCTAVALKGRRDGADDKKKSFVWHDRGLCDPLQQQWSQEALEE